MENRYGSYQPPTTTIVSKQMAQDLIISGHQLVRVERDGQGTWLYIFAGRSPEKTAQEITAGKIRMLTDSRTEASRKVADAMIQSAILDFKREAIQKQVTEGITELLGEMENEKK